MFVSGRLTILNRVGNSILFLFFFFLLSNVKLAKIHQIFCEWRNDGSSALLSVVCPSVICPSLTFHFSETAYPNSTKLERKQDLNIVYQVCVFWLDRKNKMAAPVSDWLRHFRLLLWNQWMKFNETWQEAKFQRPLPSLCFFRSMSKQKWPPWPICKKGGTLYSGARYVVLWASCYIFVAFCLIGHAE